MYENISVYVFWWNMLLESRRCPFFTDFSCQFHSNITITSKQLRCISGILEECNCSDECNDSVILISTHTFFIMDKRKTRGTMWFKDNEISHETQFH